MPNCAFQKNWLTEPEFKVWLSADKSTPHSAVCRLCHKSFDIKSMGRTALLSHMKGKKHKEKLAFLESSALSSYVSKDASAASITSTDNTPVSNVIPASTSSAVPATTTKSKTTAASQSAISDFVSKNDTLNAEILWALKCVESNYSFHSQKDIVQIFGKMFPTCDIAKSMSLGETKIMYLSCFGIAPHFTSLLEKSTQDEQYVLLFDESLNKDLQKKQLDVHLRMWDYDKVKTRYYTSDFIGHSAASDVLDSFQTKIESSIGLKNIVQLSMDGPNVNWAIFKKVQDKIRTSFNNTLIDIGSCGLHSIHNSFRSAIDSTEWGVPQTLAALHRLFKDAPARREDYEQLTQQSLYSLNYCSHRWVENAVACQRALDIFPFMQQYVNKVEKKELKNPSTKSYESVKEWILNPVSKARLYFILSVARPVEEFLTLYQTDKPMLP